ncbi:GtrA family protein [Scopulibacillus cellulosilyticus]|uniref:GtrA family protein n=1 Tax=Scopulibacillus cellulosilyticus TaxID=2665665 RepID=A0ABW2PXV8_9BACL
MNRSFFRFLLVGVFNTIIGLSIMFLCLHVLGFSYFLSTAIGNTIGAIVSYTLNRRYTFKSNKSISKSGFLFIIVVGSCYIISYYLSMVISTWISKFFYTFPRDDAAALLGAVLYTVTNYFGQKFIVFQNNSEKNVKKNIRT